MWSKLDDSLLDHPKVFAAGNALGRNGPAIALGLYTVGLMWTNKQLTDGLLPTAVVLSFQHVDKPLHVAQALVDAHLWDKVEGGYQIHDFHDHNFAADAVRARRERLSNVRSVAGKNGAAARWGNGKP